MTEPLWRRKSATPAVALLVVGVHLRVGWILVDRLWVPLCAALGWFLLPLGEASLFTFTVHLLAIPGLINLPFQPGDDLDRLHATVWVLAYLGLIWVAVIGRRAVLGWLRSGGVARAWLRRYGPLVAVNALLVGVLVASVAPGGGAGDWATDAGGLEGDAEEEIVQVLIAE